MWISKFYCSIEALFPESRCFIFLGSGPCKHPCWGGAYTPKVGQYMTVSKTWVQGNEAKLQLGCGGDGDEGKATQRGSGSFTHSSSQPLLSPRCVPGVVQGLGTEHEVRPNHELTSQTVSHGSSMGEEAVLDGESVTCVIW